MSLKSAIVAIVFWAVFCSSTTAQPLIFCSEGSPEGFDPALHTSPTTFDASSRPLYDGLTRFKPGTTEVIPALAESWQVSDDGKSVTFTLRQGVTFHTNDAFAPTRNLNADDVIFTFDRQGNPDNLYHTVSGGTWDYFNAMALPELIHKMEKVDDNVITFHLTHPYAPLLAHLAMDFASIMSKEYADAMHAAGRPEMLDKAPIGTGPFTFHSYSEDTFVRFQRNAEYWDDTAMVEDLIFAITPDPTQRYQKLQDGECHVMAYPYLSDLAKMKANDDVTVLEQTSLNIGYLAYNTQMPPFDNANVRRALDMAIDKKAIIDEVYEGRALVAKNPIPPDIWAYDHDTVEALFDPQGAIDILADEGVFDLTMKIWALPVHRSYNPNGQRLAEMIQEDLARIDVEVEIVSYDWGEYIARSKDIYRDGAVLLGWTGDNGDPDNFLSILLGCDHVEATNVAQWCNPAFETLIQNAKILPTQAERMPLYSEAQAIFKRESPWTTIAHSLNFTAMRKEVKNYIMNPFGGHTFDSVSLEN